MTNEQAAQILRDHNEWRRDRSETAPVGMPKSYNPTLLGQAIDVAVKALEQTELERFMAAVELLFPCKRGIKYLVVDEDGTIVEFEKKPRPVKTCWGREGSEYFTVIKVTIPAGIDWRDCIIERT